jgi:hypothetical protein
MAITAPKSRNEPCPCGSGKRYKDCHGRIAHAAIAAIAAPTPVANNPLLDMMTRALECQQHGQLAAAANLYDQALTLDPHQADALHMRGVVALGLGQPTEAREFMLRAQSYGLNTDALRYNLALVDAYENATYASLAIVEASQTVPVVSAVEIDPADVRLLAFYLPQFHPIPENDAWWGSGFTEWTNVRRAQPNFPGHDQPRIPGELGYYSLLNPGVRERQAQLARAHGVGGFCYYHYWFTGRRLLEQPLNAVLASGKPDFPFCVFWANENWSRRWDGGNHELLMPQLHDAQDDVAFIEHLLPAFADPRYIRVQGRPLLMLYRMDLFQDPAATLRRFTEVCRAHGEATPFVLRANTSRGAVDARFGEDGSFGFPPHRLSLLAMQHASIPNTRTEHQGVLLDYARVGGSLAMARATQRTYSTVLPGWDNTARKQFDGTTIIGSTPRLFEAWLRDRLYAAQRDFAAGERLVFVNAWNEWAEGAYLEPDATHGDAYLKATLAARQIPDRYVPIADIAARLMRNGNA